uniref:(northern house mosquito) hypothetical protein n=1 Tax=Culex pipiens TaxID=7175 RepID=A0A8D8NRP5_CULPI
MVVYFAEMSQVIQELLAVMTYLSAAVTRNRSSNFELEPYSNSFSEYGRLLFLYVRMSLVIQELPGVMTYYTTPITSNRSLEISNHSCCDGERPKQPLVM